MSQYAALDAAILANLRRDGQTFTSIYGGHAVNAECHRLAGETGAESFRILDRRLQALRKRGLIRHVANNIGWRLEEKS